MFNIVSSPQINPQQIQSPAKPQNTDTTTRVATRSQAVLLQLNAGPTGTERKMCVRTHTSNKIKRISQVRLNANLVLAMQNGDDTASIELLKMGANPTKTMIEQVSNNNCSKELLRELLAWEEQLREKLYFDKMVLGLDCIELELM